MKTANPPEQEMHVTKVTVTAQAPQEVVDTAAEALAKTLHNGPEQKSLVQKAKEVFNPENPAIKDAKARLNEALGNLSETLKENPGTTFKLPPEAVKAAVDLARTMQRNGVQMNKAVDIPSPPPPTPGMVLQKAQGQAPVSPKR